MDKSTKVGLCIMLLLSSFMSYGDRMNANVVRYAPDSILVQSNLTGTVSAIHENIADEDGNWFLASSSSTNTNLEITLQNPSTTLKTGTSLRMIEKTNRSVSLSWDSV